MGLRCMTRSARIERDNRLLESYKLYMERMNSELSVHWTRINILVVLITAALGGYAGRRQEVVLSASYRVTFVGCRSRACRQLRQVESYPRRS
jgi:hypothetical protein